MLALVAGRCGLRRQQRRWRCPRSPYCCPKTKRRATNPTTGRTSKKQSKKNCDDCEVLYSNAGGDAAKQQSQAEAALTQGADVLVVDPIDSKSAAAIAEKAKAQNVPVLSYDRLIENGEVDSYVSFDNEKVGELQAETLVEETERRRQRQRPDHHDQRRPRRPQRGALQSGRPHRVRSGRRQDRQGVRHARLVGRKRPARGQQAITALGNNGFAGVYAANDDTGGGAIAAMKGAGINPAEKPVTGQDATVAGLQRILAGQQYMTVYKEIGPEAKISAEIAVALAEGEDVPQDKITEEVNNGKAKVPSVLLEAGRRDQGQRQEHGGRRRIRHRVRTLHQRLHDGVQGSGDLRRWRWRAGRCLSSSWRE